MDPRRLFSDERMRGVCAHCGGRPTTRDHNPSLVLLDEPYPANLRVVGACEECNNSFSADERYVACMVEVALRGSADPSAASRPNVRRMLAEDPALARELAATRGPDQGGPRWFPDMDRVANVALKLARGHLDYELNIQETGPPTLCDIRPMPTMSEAELAEFERPLAGPLGAWPEIGTRAFIRQFKTGEPASSEWIVAQPGRYRYMVSQEHGNLVHMALGEYLACRIAWD
jgi:hypothetical protein